jgi:hypothetical protein
MRHAARDRNARQPVATGRVEQPQPHRWAPRSALGAAREVGRRAVQQRGETVSHGISYPPRLVQLGVYLHDGARAALRVPREPAGAHRRAADTGPRCGVR